MKTLKEAKLKGKKVLLRVDFNVTIQNGKVEDDTRMVKTLPTLEYLIKEGARIILLSHLGRPDGKVVPELKLDPVAEHLSRMLKKTVKKLDAALGSEVEQAVTEMNDGDLILLENIRFYPEEEKNDPAFARKLASLAEIYVNDGFSVAHRAHASTEGVARHLPSFAGLLMEKEVETLSQLLEKSEKPLTLIAGGAKIDTKIGLISNFITKADYFLIGGGLANTFLSAEGLNVGKSLYEPEKIEVAKRTMRELDSFRDNFILPTDVIVANEISDTAKTSDIPVEEVEGEMKILDIGSKTIDKFAEIITKSKIVVWNGPVGLFEKEPFSRGTKAIAEALKKAKNVKTILGGGDTIDAINHFGFKEDDFTFVSTGGGAMLEFLEGKKLPGIKILEK